MYKIDEFELKCLAYGAAFLGSGGGGKLEAGLKIIENMLAEGLDQVDMAETSQMGDGYAVPVALIGSAAEADEDEDFRKQITAAGQAMIDNLKEKNKDVGFIISGELGGENTIVAAYAAASLGIPLLDADCQGRAVPELGTSLHSINKIESTPLVLAAGEENTDIIITYPADPLDGNVIEKIARSVCVAYGGTAALSTWPVNREDVEGKLLPGEITKAIKLGKIILKAKENKLDIIDELKNAVDCELLTDGLVKSVDLEVAGGFEAGIVTIESEKGDYKVYFKNESLLARDESGKITAQAPDLICMIDVENYKPLTNADIEVGMKVVYFKIEAADHWKKSPEALMVWEEILEVLKDK